MIVNIQCEHPSHRGLCGYSSDSFSAPSALGLGTYLTKQDVLRCSVLKDYNWLYPIKNLQSFQMFMLRWSIGLMIFAQVKPMARKDRSNYVLVQWIKEEIMMGFVMETRQKYSSFCWNPHFIISLSLGYGSQKYESIPTD